MTRRRLDRVRVRDTIFLVLNADGLLVGEYENLDHAQEAAKDFAAEGSFAMGDFYSVTDAAMMEDHGSWQTTENGIERI